MSEGLVEGGSGLQVDKGRDVVSLLRGEDAHSVLRHVVLDEGGHLADVVHPGSVVEGVRAPDGGEKSGLALAVIAVATGVLGDVKGGSVDGVGG